MAPAEIGGMTLLLPLLLALRFKNRLRVTMGILTVTPFHHLLAGAVGGRLVHVRGRAVRRSAPAGSLVGMTG